MERPKQEKIIINTDSLRDIAIFLSGVKQGQGNLLPLGTIVLEDLWNVISYLNGDIRFVAKKDLSKTNENANSLLTT